MAIASVAAALAQYAENLNWQDSEASARLALEAIRYLTINRAAASSVAGRSVSWTALESEKALLEKFLGAGAARSFGRSRVLRTNILDGEGIA